MRDDEREELDRRLAAVSELLRSAASGPAGDDLPVRRLHALRGALADELRTGVTGVTGDTGDTAALVELLDAAHALLEAQEDVRRDAVAARELLAAVNDALPGGILVRDLDGAITYANHWVVHFLGLGHDEMLGSGLADPPYRLLDELGREIPSDRWPSARAARGESFDGAVVGLSPARGDDRIRWVTTSGRPLRDGDGYLTGGLIVFLDSTERVELGRRLLRNQQLLHDAQRIAGIATWRRDIVDGGTWISDELRELIGLAPDAEVERTTVYEFIHPDDRQELFQGTYRTFAEGTPFAAELRAIGRDGIERIVEVHAERYHDAHGRPEGLIGTVRDRTREIAEEQRFEQAQRMEMVGRLAGGLAHDLNNLLTVLTGHADLLAAGVAREHQPSIEAIRAVAERAGALTRQLLELGRRDIQQPRPVDVRALVDDLAGIVRSVVPAGVALDVDVDDDVPPVFADPSKLEQVLLNLLLNARDAVGHGGRIQLVVDHLPGEASDGREQRVRFRVVDDGIGMSPEVLARALEPFFTTKGPGAGTGLGLATAYGIVAQAGGHLELESELGHGTTATVVVPAAVAPAEETVAPQAVDAARRPATILLAEDEPELRDLLRMVLAERGHHVIVGVDGLDAYDAAGRAGVPIDLLVTDVSMPRRDGHELAESLSAVFPGMEVVYMSGYTESAALRDPIRRRTVHFLPKPFGLGEFVEMVDTVLARRAR